ncbi:MAG: hypothetical protein U9R56_03425, partial [candidate division Zixibacteria bacterium]|nr:hypothetical protein [candidate division Zixibacteria bacterium]
MNHKVVAIVISNLIVALLAVVQVQAAKSPYQQRIGSAHYARVLQYSFADEHDFLISANEAASRIPLGYTAGVSIAPGVKVGGTWYDLQHCGSIGRMIDWGYEAENGLGIHFSWTYLPAPILTDRAAKYNSYKGGDGTFSFDSTGMTIQGSGEYAGFVGIDVTDDGRAVVGCHNDQGGGYQSQFYWDWAPHWGAFLSSRIPDNCAGPYDEVIWPKFRYQETGPVPITHVFAQLHAPSAGAEYITYFRKLGENETGAWDCEGSYTVDTIFGGISQDIVCSNFDSKVALVWVANLCPDLSICDTCSSYMLLDYDIYYQISYDYGEHWQPRVNLTKNIDGEAGYRPYTDLSALITTDNNLHIGWSGRVWPADGEFTFYCRMFHWGENLGFNNDHSDGLPRGNIRTVANLDWSGIEDPELECNGGSWQMNGSKMSLSECDGKLYFLWVQFNDLPNGIGGDCAERAWASEPLGAANGELYLSVSGDDGVTWDAPRNLTNTRTPHCDSATGVGGRCQSEHWPSMARFGTALTGDMSNAYILDPTGAYTGDYFLDVQYIDDADPGSIIHDEGTWQLADVRWFRLACVEPVMFPPPYPWIYPQSFGYPTWTPHGVQLDTTMVLTNNGNVDINFTLTVEQDTGPPDWLVPYGFESGVVPAGLDNTLVGTLNLNAGGVVNDPGTTVYLSGRLIFTSNVPTSPDTVPVELWVTDSIPVPGRDTLFTDCLALTVNSSGNFGNMGVGCVNMDFFNYGDCDTEDTIPGHTEIYIYDGSPIICWTDETDTVRCNFSIYSESWISDRGFIPVSSVTPVD